MLGIGHVGSSHKRGSTTGLSAAEAITRFFGDAFIMRLFCPVGDIFLFPLSRNFNRASIAARAAKAGPMSQGRASRPSCTSDEPIARKKKLAVAGQLAASPMRLFARWIEHALDETVCQHRARTTQNATPGSMASYS